MMMDMDDMTIDELTEHYATAIGAAWIPPCLWQCPIDDRDRTVDERYRHARGEWITEMRNWIPSVWMEMYELLDDLDPIRDLADIFDHAHASREDGNGPATREQSRKLTGD